MKTKTNIIWALFIFLFAYSSKSKAQAQDSVIHTPVWLTLALGGGSSGFTTGLSLNVDLHNYLFSIEPLVASTADNSELFQTSDFTEFFSTRFCIGRVFPDPGGDFLFVASTGISINSIEYHYISGGFLFGNSSMKRVSTIGIPLDLRMIIPTRSAVGLDLGMKFDFNKEKTLIAFIFGLRFGRIMAKR